VRLANLPSSASFDLIDDPGIGKVVAFANLYEGWTFHAGTWERLYLRPPICFVNSQPLPYDPAIRGLVTIGNTYDDGCAEQCVWIWTTGTAGFTNITSVTRNTEIECAAASDDPALAEVLCLGSPNGTAPAELWAFA
jgi:hypothetical protein